MKKNKYIFLFLFLYQISFAKDNFSLKPILLNYYGITGKDSTIIAYGNFGSYQISYDGDKTWTTKKAFDKGLINKMFIEDDRIVAFTDDGQIAVSYDNANSWEQKSNIDIMSLENDIYNYTYILATKKGYAIRKKQNIYFVNKNLELIKTLEYPLQDYLFKPGFNISGYKTMLYDDGNLIVPFETFGLIFFDEDLNQIKFVDLNKHIKVECIDCSFNNKLVADNDYYYFRMHTDTYKVKKDFSEYEELKSKDTKKNNSLHAIIANKLLFKSSILGIQYYSLNDYDSLDVYYEYGGYKNGSFEGAAIRYFSKPTNMQDYYYNTSNDKLYLVQDFNTIRLLTNFSKKEEIEIHNISLGQYHHVSRIDFFKAGDYLLSTDISDGICSLPFSRLKVNSNIFESNMSNNKNNNTLLDNSIFQFYYYNEIDSSITLGTRQGIFSETDLFVSKDGGSNFNLLKNIPDSVHTINFDVDRNQFNFNKKLNAHFFNQVSSYFEGNDQKFKSKYILLDTSYDNITNFWDIDIVSHLAHFYNIDDLVTFGKSNVSNQFVIKTTSNKGEDWEFLKEYDIKNSIIDSKELILNGKTIWAFSIYDSTTKDARIEVFDLESKKVKIIYEKQLLPLQRLELNYIAFDASNDKFYISFYDTLFVSKNIFDANPTWETFNYPNNGRVNKKFQVFDTTIFVRYSDDRNEDNVYWINGINLVGDVTSVENTIEEVNYLYTLPPYPNPTRSEITTKFYWDSSINIDNSDISVFDLNGNKVSNKENLRLEKLDVWTGNIIWDTSNQPKGTYLLKIQHGNNTKSVKIMVE